MKKTILLLASSLTLLAGCNNPNPATTSNPVSTPSEASVTSTSPKSEETYDSLEAAFAALGQKKNYDVYTVADYSYGDDVKYYNYYNPSYVYCDFENAEEGYAEVDGEVYRFNKYGDRFVNSDAYDVESLWGSDLVKTLAFSSNLFSGVTGKVVEITNKKAKLQWLEFLEVDLGEIINITSAKVEMKGNKLSDLVFTLTIEGASFVSSIEHVDDGGDAAVEEYISTHKAITYDEILLSAKADFATNNFVRVIEDELTVSDTKKTVIGHEYYLPNYFYTHYLPSSGYGIQSNGYLSLHNKKIVSQGETVYFDGAYMFTLTEDLSEIYGFLSTGPAFVTNTYDMASIMNYPSLMNMWEHNFQFFELTMGSDYDGVTYKTTDQKILHDFYYFSQIAAVLPEEFATRSLTSLSISIDEGVTDAKSDDKVVFLFELKNDGQKFKTEFKYERFGNANIPAVEEFAANFIPAN